MPSATVRLSTRRTGFLSLVAPKRRSPSPQHDGEDLQPQLADEVVLQQRVDQLEAGGDDDPSHLASMLRGRSAAKQRAWASVLACHFRVGLWRVRELDRCAR